MKYFVTSDIHSYYSVLRKTIVECGYDEENKEHKLVICGDLFDRGTEPVEVYRYIKRLTDEEKAIVISGNHDEMLIDFLTDQKMFQKYTHKSGIHETIKGFYREATGLEIEDFDYPNLKIVINNAFPKLLSWLRSFPLFFETESHILVHAGVDCNPMSDWKESSPQTLRWVQEFHKDEFDTSHITKNIIMGHYRTSRMDQEHRDGDFGIYKKGNKIFIDSNVVESSKLNIYTFED